MQYVRETVPEGKFSLSEIETERALTLVLIRDGPGLIRTAPGILFISIRNAKPKRRSDFTVEACNFPEDWHPYWDSVKQRIDALPQAVPRDPRTITSRIAAPGIRRSDAG